jgi:ribulose-phosphate 3-epimerase
MIAPSILAADFSRLGELVREATAAGANRIHIDVMDGHFVPNLSMGSVVCKGLRPVTDRPLEVHLMVEDPWKFVDGFIAAGADTVIFHLEVAADPIPVLKQIREAGKKVGLAFNPDSPIDRIAPFLADIDLALLMTVFPGFGGQSYRPESNARIRQLAKLIRERNPNCELEVDGGIDSRTIGDAARAGANVFVAGTAVFGAKAGIATAIRDLSALAKVI